LLENFSLNAWHEIIWRTPNSALTISVVTSWVGLPASLVKLRHCHTVTGRVPMTSTDVDAVITRRFMYARYRIDCTVIRLDAISCHYRTISAPVDPCIDCTHY